MLISTTTINNKFLKAGSKSKRAHFLKFPIRRKLAMISLVLLVVSVLFGCAQSDEDGPDEDLILKDIQASLSEYQMETDGYELAIAEFSVVKSVTEQMQYSAQLDVVAEAKYSDLLFITDVTYTKYDQGWMIDGCEWEFVSYEVARYPDNAEMETLKEACGIQNSSDEEIILNGDNIELSTRCVAEWSEFAVVEGVVTSKWLYSFENDSWEFDSQTTSNSEIKLKDSLEKTWEMGGLDPGYAYVSNVSENGFDLRMDTKCYATDTVHMTLTDGRIEYEDKECIILVLENSDIAFDTKKTAYGGEKSYSGKLSIVIKLYREPISDWLSGGAYDMTWEITVNEKNYDYNSGSSAYILN